MIVQDVKNIATNVRVTNLEAKKLYNRLGFEDGDTIYAYSKKI